MKRNSQARQISAGLALALLASPSMAGSIVAATNAERASGFATIADCERSLGAKTARAAAAPGTQEVARGSLLNRASGNLSRCEMVDGEVQLVVYPNPGSAAVTD